MIYPIDAYDQHGQLKINTMLWCVLLFNAKAWLVFIMAGVSRTQGGDLLALIYPIKDTLYLGMAIGSPAIALMWLSGQRNNNKKWINILWRQGKYTLLAAYIVDFVVQIYHLMISHGAFHWLRAITLLLTVWLSLYLLRSSRVRDIFAD